MMHRVILVFLLVCLVAVPVSAQEPIRTFTPTEEQLTATEIESKDAPGMLLTYPQNQPCQTWDCDFENLSNITWWYTPQHIYPHTTGEIVACGYPVNSLGPIATLTYPDGGQEQVRLFRNIGPQYFNARMDGFVCYSYEHKPQVETQLGKYILVIEYEGTRLEHSFRIEYPYCRYAVQFSENQIAFSGFEPNETLDIGIYSYQKLDLPSELDPYRIYGFVAARTASVGEDGTLLLTVNTGELDAVHIEVPGLLRLTYPRYTLIGTEKVCNGDLSAYLDGRNANMIIVDDAVPVYAEASDTSNVVAELPQGTEVRRIIAQEILGDVPYYQIRTVNGIQGWVRGMVFARTDLQSQLPVSTTETCPGFIESRLSVNGWAQLSPFAPAAPILSSYPNGTELAQVALDTPVQILAGPYCSSDRAWWQVNYIDPFNENELIAGWVQEGQGSEYWFDPLN